MRLTAVDVSGKGATCHFDLLVVPPGPETDGEPVDTEHRAVLGAFARRCKRVRRATPDGPCTFQADWTPLLRDVADREPIKIRVRAELAGADPSRPLRNVMGHALELFLYDAALAGFLAAPGAQTVGRAKCEGHFSIDLWGGYAEYAWLAARRRGWPSLKTLPFGAVWEWIQAVRGELNQVAESSTERALFALLHAFHWSVEGQVAAIWLAHALESIYATGKGGGVQALLRRRVGLVMGGPVAPEAPVRGFVSRFYSYRSDFVHGRLSVWHPARNDLIDSRYDEKLQRAIEATEAGTAVVIGSMQELISRRWTKFVFDESVRGEQHPILPGHQAFPPEDGSGGRSSSAMERIEEERSTTGTPRLGDET